MSHANKVAQEACDLLAHRKLCASTGVRDPDGWLVIVKRDMRAEHYATFEAMLAKDPTLTATQLADSVTGRAQEAETEMLNTSSRLPTVSDEGWEPLDSTEAMTARSGLGRAREALREARKP